MLGNELNNTKKIFVIEKCQEEGGQTSVDDHNILKMSIRNDRKEQMKKARKRMKILGN